MVPEYIDVPGAPPLTMRNSEREYLLPSSGETVVLISLSSTPDGESTYDALYAVRFDRTGHIVATTSLQIKRRCMWREYYGTQHWCLGLRACERSSSKYAVWVLEYPSAEDQHPAIVLFDDEQHALVWDRNVDQDVVYPDDRWSHMLWENVLVSVHKAWDPDTEDRSRTHYCTQRRGQRLVPTMKICG